VTAAAASRRLLIVTSTFFPDRSVGAVRVTQWSRFLPEYGWAVRILCRYYGRVATPEALAKQVHPSVDLSYLDRPAGGALAGATRRGGTWQLKAWLKAGFAGRLAARALVPDVQAAFWRSPRTYARVRDVIENWRPDVVLTSSPPHSCHAVGMAAAVRGTPWVADFRDPFLIDARYRPAGIDAWKWPLFQRYNRAVYTRAHTVVHAIPLHARWARQAFRELPVRVRCLPNGVPQPLVDGTLAPSPAPGGVASFRSIGVFGEEEGVAVCEAIARLREGGLPAELRLVGPVPNAADRYRQVLGPALTLTGPLTHHDALLEVLGADVLLCVLSQYRSQSLGLSSKLFEYIATGKPIVVIRPTRSDRHLLRDWPEVQQVHDPEPVRLSETLRAAFTESRCAITRPRVDVFRQAYARKAQAAELSSWLAEAADQSVDAYRAAAVRNAG